MNDRLLSYAGVKELTSLSESTVRRLVKAGKFPAPELLTPGRKSVPRGRSPPSDNSPSRGTPREKGLNSWPGSDAPEPRPRDRCAYAPLRRGLPVSLAALNTRA